MALITGIPSPIVAIYETNSNASIAAVSVVIVNFEDLIVDTHGAVTTGASWKFTAPVTGIYEVNAVVSLEAIADGKPMDARIHKNGSLYWAGSRLTAGNVADTIGSTISALVSMNAGDYIDIRVYNGDSTNRVLSSSAAFNKVSISKWR